MQKSKMTADGPNILERREVGIVLNAVQFVTNFILFYFICISVFPDITGLVRLVLCWVGAYTLTWIMTLLAKGAARLLLTLLFLGVLYIVFRYQP